MDFELDRDIVFFDIESTGLSIVRDRILQIAMIKYFKNGEAPEEKMLLINPGVPISQEAMEIHGITPKDVANKPTFGQVADEIYNFIGNADLGGYNSNRFDVPMLMEEFARVGMNLDIRKRRLIDVQRIFYKMEPRTLKGAYRFYCDKNLEDAHDALIDIRATVEVLKGQLKKYEGLDLEDEDGNHYPSPIKNDMQAIHDFVNDMKYIEPTQKLILNNEGEVVFNFGKYVNQPVGPTLSKDRNYFNWIQNMEFSSQVKQMCKQLVKDFNSKDY